MHWARLSKHMQIRLYNISSGWGFENGGYDASCPYRLWFLSLVAESERQKP